MSIQATQTKYLAHFKFRAPEINLPFKRPALILSYFDINEEKDLWKTASCKGCQKRVNIVRGRGVNSSYTFALTFHLRNHSTEWQNFLDNLASQIVPDEKTKYEHFKQMEVPKAYSKDQSNKRFDESNLWRNFI